MPYKGTQKRRQSDKANPANPSPEAAEAVESRQAQGPASTSASRKAISMKAKASKDDSTPAAPRLPPEVALKAKGPTEAKTGGPFTEAIFAPDGISAYQVKTARYSPEAPGFEEVCKNTYSSLAASSRGFSDLVTPELFRLYVAELLWLRWYGVNRAEGEDLPPDIEQLLSRVDTTVIEVPEPIYKWLLTFGTLMAPTGEKLKTQVLPAPREWIGGFPGFWGPVNQETHNLYEELPSLGLCTERVRASLHEPYAPRYVSELDPRLNENALGFGRVAMVRPGQRSYLSDLGFSINEVPTDTNAWGFSMAVLRRVSNALTETCSETFRLTPWSVLGTNPTGSIAQLTLWRPVITEPNGTPITKGEVSGESLIRSTTTLVGVSLTYLLQLYKEPALDPANGPNASPATNSWCCVTHTQADPLPQEWSDNRNVRRTFFPPR